MGEALRLLIRMDELFARGDFDGWLGCIDDDVVYRNFNDSAARGEWLGKEAAMAAMLGGTGGGYGDAAYHLQVTGYRDIGDDVAIMEWAVTISPANAAPATTRGCALFRVRASKVVEIFEVAERQARDVSVQFSWQSAAPPNTRFAPPIP